MQSDILGKNYFELFNSSITFEIDLIQLTQQFRNLQCVVHPDRYANGTDTEKRLSVQQSAYINEAFQTLKNPLRRAKYILQFHGVDLANDHDTNMDSVFLMQQMELREQLESAKESDKPIDQLIILGTKIDSGLDELIQEIRELFSKGVSAHLQQARDVVRKLQFMTRLREEVEQLEEQYL